MSSAVTQVAYRWVEVRWTASPIYRNFELQWRTEGTTRWETLPTDASVDRNMGRRARIRGHEADIRGFPHSSYRIEIQVLGLTSNRRSEPSGPIPVAVDYRPPMYERMLGHQHDHTIGYSLSSLGISVFETNVRARARIAADAWARLTVVDACETPCGQNGDGGVIKVKPAILTDLSKWNFGCSTSGACVKNLPTKLEGHIRNHDMVFEQPPDSGEGTREHPHQRYRWTLDPSKTGKTGMNNAHPDETWAHLPSTILHEFGHAVGIRNVDERVYTSYHGIMSKSQTAKRITDDDRNMTNAIYISHIAGAGW